MRPLLPRLVALGTILVSGGCVITGPDADTRLTLYVAPQTAPCVGVGPQTCLVVRDDPQGDWTFFYDAIEGFTHEPGYAYTLSVLRREVPDPPADGSSFEYRLMRIVERQAVPTP